MIRTLRLALMVAILLAAPGPAAVAAPAEGQLTWALHVALAPTWFDPAEAPGILTPFMVIYGLHDALVRPMPGNPMSPSLAESWSASPDGLSWDFVLRKGVRFHNGDVLTADDVKFSFDRYRGVSSKLFKDKVQQVQVVDPHRVRFQLREPWPDFLTFYATPATGASWIVPKKYVEKVSDDGFKKAPIGAGPYRFVSFTPGVELVLEAFDQYWRKSPNLKRVVLRAVPDEATRLAALKRGEVDIAFNVRGALAEDLQRTPGLTLKPTVGLATHWAYFAEQWDPKSPWHDRRVRLAANHAIDRNAINQADALGHAKVIHSIIPSTFEYYWQPPGYGYDVARAKQLLTEAGYPVGFDAGEYVCDAGISTIAEAVVNYLNAAGIRVRLRPIERAAFFKGFSEKKHRGVVHSSSGAFGNAATRIEAFISGGGTYAYGSYADIDGLFREQVTDLDPRRRAATLERIQQLVHEKAMFAPIFLNASINGIGPKVAEGGFGLIAGYLWSAPYEDLKIKGK